MKEITEKSYSCENQDQFVYHLFRQKERGTFLDIACGPPVSCSNSYLLESELNWSGLGVDIADIEKLYQWSEHRSSKFLRADVTGLAFPLLLEESLDSPHVDYFSLDVDHYNCNYSLFALRAALHADVSFKFMTYEHESFKYGDKEKELVGAVLRSMGYVRLFGATFPTGRPWEDWYIDPRAFDSSILNLRAESVPYPLALEKIKKHNEGYSSYSS
jgi:hypothetical protein